MRSLFLYLLLALPLGAQSDSAVLTGVVLDEKGGALLNAQVTLQNQARGLRRETVTGANGEFVFPPLPAGQYELECEYPGLTAEPTGVILLNAADRRFVRIRMRVATEKLMLQVTAPAEMIRVDATVATAVERQFIEAQPLNGRTLQALVFLAPGIIPVPATLPDQGQFSVNGQRTGTNYFTLDGVSANFGLPFATTPYEGAGGGIPSLSSLGSTSALVSVDAVQEFAVQTSTYAPEYGRQPGAQVTVVTRSGTNEFHGSLFHYFRNDKLDANSWFGNANRLPRPALRQNDFGFTLGGPVWLPGLYAGRDRSYFFVSYEGLRLRQPVVSTASRVPSLEARQSATGLLKALLEAYPLPVAPPLASAPLETPYSASFSNPSRMDSLSVRGDHNLSAKWSIFGRVSTAPSENRERGRYATPSFVAVLPARTDSLTGGFNAIFTPRLSAEFRAGFGRAKASQIYEQDTFGGAKLLPLDQLFPSFADPATSLFYLTIGSNDESTLSPGPFSRNTQRQYNVVSSLSWVTSSHVLKFGADLRALAPTIGGRLYTKTLVFSSITELASGVVPSGEIRQVDTFLEPRYWNYSAFAQDAWKLHPRLQLTYGLRWEVNPAPSEANGNLPLTVTGLGASTPVRLAPRGSRLYPTTYGNLAPRAGLAYQLFPSWGTVLRGGVGIFYDLGYSFTGTAFSPGNYPYSRIRTVENLPLTDTILYSPLGPQSYEPPYPRLFDYIDDYRLPYSWQYNFTIEQAWGSANQISLGYVGSAGRRLARVESFRTQTLQNPDFTRIDHVNNLGYSDYHSFQAQFRRRMSRGVGALLSYTWAKSLDTASDESISNLQAPSLRVNPNLDRGPSSFDVRHALSGTASFQLPSLRADSLLKSLTEGFALDTIFRYQTAPPVTVVTGRDPLGLGLTNVSRPDLVAGQPLYLYGANYPGGKRLNPAAFDAATPLAQRRQGTLGRGVLRGFGMSQVDISLRRQFRLAESVRLDFRCDAFNVFNTPSFASPVNVLTSTNFGLATRIFSTASVNGLNPLYQLGGPRSVQMALKLYF